MPEVSSILNIFFLGVLLFGAFIGFIRGSKKALFYFVFFGAFLLICLLAFPFIVNVALTKEVQGFSARASLIDLLSNNNPELLVLVEEDTLAYSFLETVVSFLAKHVWIVVIMILAFFVLPMITSVFWLIFRKKHKKTFLKRIVGSAIGALHSGVYVMIIAIIISGFTSIAKPAYNLIENSESTGGILQLSNGSEEDMIEAAIESYQNSLIGKAFNIVKIKKKPLDLYLYDQTFNLKFNKHKIYLREEVVNVVLLAEDVLAEIDVNDGDILSSIAKVDDDVLTLYVNRLADLKLVNVIFPLGIEVIFTTDIIDLKDFSISNEDYKKALNINYQQEIKHLGYIGIDALDLIVDTNINELNFLGLNPDKVESIFTNLGELELMNIALPVGIGYLLEQEAVKNLVGNQEISLQNIDFKAEFTNLGTLYKDLYALNINTNYLNQVDYLDLNVTAVKKALASVGNLQIVNIVGPIAVNMALEIDTVKEIFSDLEEGFSDISFKSEFVALGNLYEAMHELGIKTLNLDEIKFDEIEDEKIEKFSSALYSLQLVQKSTPSVVNYLVNNMMPKEFSNYISPDSIKQVNWNAKEVESILLLGKLLLSNGVLDDNFDFTKLLTEATTSALAKYMANSQLISGNITSLVRGLINDQNISFLSNLTIEDEFVWTEDELYQILQVARYAQDLLVDGDLDFTKVPDETLEALATAMSSSTIISGNMTPIFTSLVEESDVGLSIEVKEDFKWSNREINSILKSVKIVFTKGGDMTNLFGVSDEEIDTFLSSELITQAMINYFYEYTKEGSELDGIIVVKLTKDDQSWFDKYEDDERISDGELRKLIKSLGLLFGDNYVLGEDIDINIITSLTDQEITSLLDSKIVNDSVRHMLINLANEDGDLNNLLVVNLDENDERWNDSTEEEGEIRKLIKAFKLVFGEDFDINNPDLNINVILNLSEDDIKVLLDSLIISDSIINQIYTLSAEGGDLHGTLVVPARLENYDSSWYGEDGELKAFIQSMQVIIPADGNINSFEINMILDLENDQIDKLLSSQVVSDSIINQIYTLSAEGGDLHGTLVVPARLENYDSSWYGEDGELKAFIQSMQVIIPADGNINSFEINMILDLEDNQINTLINSQVVSDSMINQIYKLSAEGGDLHGTLVVPEKLENYDSSWYGEDGELKAFIQSMQVIIPEDGDINELNLNLKVFYDDDNLDKLLASNVMEETIIKHIEESDNDALVTTRLHEEGELRRFFTAMSVILPEGEINNLDLNLKVFYDDDNLDKLLASNVMEDTIIRHIEDSENDALVTTRLHEEGELRRFFTAMSVILPEGEIDNLDLNLKAFYVEDDLNTILASNVMEDTIVKHIEESNNDALVTTRLRKDGEVDRDELRRFFTAMSVILPEGEIDSLDLNLKVFYVEDNLDKLLASNIMEDTIIKHIEDSENDALVTTRLHEEGELRRFFTAMSVIIPEGEIDNLDLNLQVFYDDNNLDKLLASNVMEDTIIKHIEDSENEALVTTRLREEGELRRFFTAMSVILPEGEIDNLDLNLQVFYDDNSLNKLLASNVMEDTIVKHIKESQIATSGTLAVASLDNPGELEKFFKAISKILPSGDIEEANFEVQTMYEKSDEDIDTIFASQVITDSVISEIHDKNPGVLNTSRIDVKGELPRLIKAFRVIIPTGDIEHIDLEVDTIKALDSVQLNTLITSRVIEDSIIDVVEPMFEPGGILHLYFNKPSEIDSQWEREYNEDGSVKTEGELLPFIEAIKLMEDAGVPRDQINITSIANSNSDKLASAILQSNLIAKSISKMFNQVLVDAELDDHPLSPYPIENKDYTHQELKDIIDGIRFLSLLM